MNIYTLESPVMIPPRSAYLALTRRVAEASHPSGRTAEFYKEGKVMGSAQRATSWDACMNSNQLPIACPLENSRTDDRRLGQERKNRATGSGDPVGKLHINEGYKL